MRTVRWGLLVVLILVVSGAVLGEELDPTHRQIADRVVQEILGGNTDGVRVVATPVPIEEGTRCEFLWSGGEVEVPQGAVWFALADEYPGVLGYHPVTHVFLDESLDFIEIRDATYYPRFYVEGVRRGFTTLIAYRAAPGIVPPDRERAVSPPSTLDAPESNFSYNDFHAVIIEGDVPSGDSYSEFWTDNVQMFRLLLEYGYQDDHIHVLYGEGNDEEDWFCEYYREQMVDYPAYQQDARNLFTWMRDGNAEEGIPQVSSEDFIFLFTFDHGGSSGGCDATLCFMDGCMPDTEFASYFNDIPYKHRAVDMQQCHSGGFIDNLENTTTVISTAANCTESAYEADEQDTCDGHPVKYGEWNYWWMSAMQWHKPWPGEEPVDADVNDDGIVSFQEAHNYAVDNDDRTEHPMWSDPGGLGDQLSLNTRWEGAHLVHQSHTNDDSAGNGDGVVDAGETIVMPLTLLNNGESDASGIGATLRTDNAWVTVTDPDAPFPDIPAGTSAESYGGHYEWSTDPGTPNATHVQFLVDWTANGGSSGGTTAFFEKIVRVLLAVHQTSVDDVAGGDGNGIADPGESIRLAVTLRNRGDADARSVSATLETDSPWATVTDGNAAFPDIPGQSQARSLPDHFGLDIDPSTPDKTWVDCSLHVSAADGYQITLPVRFMVGSRGTVLLVEDGDPANADILEALVADLGFGVERQRAADTDPETWSTYNLLVWTAGGNVDPVADAGWRTSLQQHVADGGRLLIEGGEVGRDHRYDTDFRTQVLHMASWYSDNGDDLRVADPVHPISTVPAILESTLPVDALQYADRDMVTPASDAVAVLSWSNYTSRASLIAYDDDDLVGNGGQVVALFVATDVIDEAGGHRRAVIENVMEWLLGNDLPYLVYAGHTIEDGDMGNGDGVADPGEPVHLVVTLANEASGAATQTWARASSDQPTWVTFTDNFADWADLASGTTAPSESPHLVVRFDEAMPCGTVVGVTLEISTAEGFHATRTFSFKVGTGGGQHATYYSDDTPMQIPNPGTADSSLTVPVFRIADVNCSVDVTHSGIGLISAVLRSPEGTEVTLHDRTGSGRDLQTTYDTQTVPDGPGSMSDFDGEEATGDWHLLVEDHAGDLMQGLVNSWSLIFDTADMCHEQTCGEPIPGSVGNTLRMSRIAGTDARLEWGPATGAAGYNVWRCIRPDFSCPETAGYSETTTFDEVGLPAPSEIYYYLVRAQNHCCEEGP